MERKLNIGNNIILVSKRDTGYVGDEDINSFMEKIGISPKEYLKIRSYIVKDLYKLGIYPPIQERYANRVTTQITLIIEGNYGRGFEAIIDDPDEVARFLVGEEAIAIDQNGTEYEVRGDSSIVLDWTKEESDYFFFEKVK